MIRNVLDREPDDRVSVLDSDGTVVAPELVPNLDDETLVSMYEDMRLCRRFDERIISLQRQGRVGTYASLAGQEGAQIGSTYALATEDTISYQYREHGTVLSRGFPWEYLLYWMGHEVGNAVLPDDNVLPLNISIGGHLPHAVGYAWAAKLRGDDRVTLVHFGEGSTSEGDFHEAANFAGVYDVPIVFFCNNNQWAISTPREQQTASETFAEKARAYGFDGIQVDGMDPLATYVVTEAVRSRAANPLDGEPRPTMIEAVQYRFGAHTTADDPTVYRDDAEVEHWKERDPIRRFEAYLRGQGLLDDERIDAMESAIDETLQEAINRAESYEGDPDDIFEDTYANPTERLVEQRAFLGDLRATYGDEALLEEN
ncbi:pyruvate dehydrogenase (acetyl-transferring) E1 component subunit alpha [Natronosalvus rutilus]|uniref:Pyruvate dehydrogenase (Acetyl-transferring) E1 component subunit alpha n=1 Tax=Natronosalvus rutilus TaxID=2953753 RepID=A0A9E7N8T7_9EURY|nr:pyruvate dehydrogenase (acetyl-transferring) E1 component subunit alpha [Natronosalvus rutilus]UTF52222.1 pyruvate dehydrogenase (acetyl-transferring) E1 component subunit alpha [Natronosalvus rutilus]